jgi:hypothetical protein
MSIERSIEAPIIVMSPIGTHSPVLAWHKSGSYRVLNCRAFTAARPVDFDPERTSRSSEKSVLLALAAHGGNDEAVEDFECAVALSRRGVKTRRCHHDEVVIRNNDDPLAAEAHRSDPLDVRPV